MSIINQELWDDQIKNNQDDYGKAVIDTARKVMEYLDRLAPENSNYDVHDLICKADDEVDAGGLSGFQAGAVAHTIVEVHSRGQEFQEKWNLSCGGTGKEKGTINPAILTIEKD